MSKAHAIMSVIEARTAISVAYANAGMNQYEAYNTMTTGEIEHAEMQYRIAVTALFAEFGETPE